MIRSVIDSWLARSVLLAFVVSCAPSSLVRVAQSGERAALAAQIDAKLKAGELSAGDVREISRTMLQFELASAKDGDVVKRLDEASSCARLIVDFLDERRRRHDDAGARAAMMLLELGRLDPSEVRDRSNENDADWRAVGVRGLVRDGDAPARAKALGDPDARVRRSALRAIDAAKNATDAARLLETAQFDPETINRHQAVRILATFESVSGPEVTALRDLWESADEILRREIATAWAASNGLFANGGREQLIVLLAAGGLSASAIAASAAVARFHRVDKELDALAVATLERALLHGSRFDKVHALSAASATDSKIVHDAVLKLADDPDAEIRLALHTQLAALPERRAESLAALWVFARDHDHPVAPKARQALARLGVRSVLPLLERDTGDKNAEVRLGAVDALLVLDAGPRAAKVITDSDVSVRTRAVCALGR